MGFASVKVKNFRNLEDQEIDLSRKEIFLIGENGQGKTNFLEMLYFLCYASSFRIRNDKTLIREGEDSFFLSARFHHSTDPLTNRLDLFLDSHSKNIKFNGKTVSDRKDILANMPCIVFCHNDMYFVNGNPEKKRTYLDQCLSLQDPFYINDLRMYKKLLKERNYLLKNRNLDLLDVYSEQLVDKGLILTAKRDGLTDYLNNRFCSYYRKVTGSSADLKIVYNQSWKSGDKQKILDQLKSRKEKEIQYGLTTIGPHRDSFTIQQGDQDFVDYASTGQLRIISLLLRILQSEYYQQSSGKNPVLLVDDVLLELDQDKRNRMMDLFPGYEQIFYTFLPGYIRQEDKDALYFRVNNGKLELKNGKS